jgi:electron transfer flavoprotein beta subunit
MNIIVLVKQIPDSEYFSKLQLDPVKHTLIREGIPAVINPADKCAIELAISLKKHYSFKVIAVSMGPEATKNSLKEAIAMGCDEAILITGKEFAGADTLATSYALSQVIIKIHSYNMVIAGNVTLDGSTGQTPIQVGEFLDIPTITNINSLSYHKVDNTADISRIFRGVEQHMKVVEMPFLVTVSQNFNKPHLPSVMDIIKASKKDIITWGIRDINADKNQCGIKGSPTETISTTIYKNEREKVVIIGADKDAVKIFVDNIKKWLVV